MPSGIKMTLEYFIKESNEIHDNKYNYDLITEFKGCRKKVPIVCPEHGEFWQLPYAHLQGKGCRLCANKLNKERLLYTTETFIKKAREVHGDKFDYSKVDYKTANEKVCIICPEHGEFWMLPKSHLQGQGCPRCGGVYHYTNEDWINIAKQKHLLENYDYTKTKYVNNREKVCIICPEHGEFWRNPKTFLYSKTGCPYCGFRSVLEERLSEIFKNENINYMREVTRKKFSWLDSMRLDFYLPDYNIAIECQGIQHFEPVDFAGKGKRWASEVFKKTLIRDKKKKELCEENNIRLLYFSNLKYNYPYEVIVDEKILLNKIYNK